MANKPISIDEAGHREEEKKKHFRKIIIRRGKGKRHYKINRMAGIIKLFSIIWLNSPIKRHRQAD